MNIRNFLIRFIGGAAALFGPVVAFAQNSIGVVPASNNAFTILGVISNIFGILIPILVTLAVIYVIWNVIKYTTAADDDSQATARKGIISGIIALFVIVSIWGLVAVLNSTFGIGQGGQNVGNCQPIYDPAQQDFVLPPQCL